jgi:aryl-alcohol dehydrogenase-like predicted oxidoreductase
MTGFNTFDLADIYGPAEDIAGAYHKQYGPKEGLFYTKVRPSYYYHYRHPNRGLQGGRPPRFD